MSRRIHHKDLKVYRIEQGTPVTAIGEDQHMHQYIFENAVVGMFRTTPEGKLITVNPAYARMFGYSSPEEVVNCNLNVFRKTQ